ncbi:MAG: glucose-6-phosphate isomerase [Patescibacteria group bacterium]
MAMPHQNPTKTTSWKSLERHADRLSKTTIKSLIEQNPGTLEAMHVSTPFGQLMFGYQRLDSAVLADLDKLTEECQLKAAKLAMISGDIVNETEQRQALHVALRTPECNPTIDGQPIQDLIHAVQSQMKSFVEQTQRSFIKDIIHLGIGGSDLGPRAIVDALRFALEPKLRVHFVSNVDAHAIHETLEKLKPETTLVVIASKTFTTQETMLNAQIVKAWLEHDLHDATPHMAALTSNVEAATAFGVRKDRIFGFWDWVGGRYSLWSSIGMPIALAYGFDAYKDLLAGANQADEDFFGKDSNAATVLALMGIWNTQFLGMNTEAVIAYDERLRLLPTHLQQLRMESNGKSVDRDGQPVTYPTNPVLIAGTGTDSQHAFFQQFHQGTTQTAFEFYAVETPSHPYRAQHGTLLANAKAQTEALALGDPEATDVFKKIAGNHPSCFWILNEISAQSLGYLFATQEHRTFVQGQILNINSFDQFGVELGKRLAKKYQ